ncbi:unnamed protein product, partial [Symbiodinium sp. KB8]
AEFGSQDAGTLLQLPSALPALGACVDLFAHGRERPGSPHGHCRGAHVLLLRGRLPAPADLEGLPRLPHAALAEA